MKGNSYSDNLNLSYLESIVMGVLILFYPDIIGNHIILDWIIACSFILTSFIGMYFLRKVVSKYWWMVITIGILQFLWGYFLYLLIRFDFFGHVADVLVMFTTIIIIRGFLVAYHYGKEHALKQEELDIALNSLRRAKEKSEEIDKKKVEQ